MASQERGVYKNRGIEIMATTNPAISPVSDIIMRRDECKKWMNLNYWAEWIDTWRMIKCRTKPIYAKDSAGKETNQEDKSRTNVESGLANLIYRKNVARLSAQPYTLRVSGGDDPSVGARMSALLAKQYDNSQEQPEDQRVRMAAEAFGIGISKIYWDYISRTMVFRKAVLKDGKVVYRDRKSMMKARGASDEEIQKSVEELSPNMTDEEVQDFMGKSGTELTVPEEVKKYEGPRVMCCFPGDVFWEPFAKTLLQSSFIIHSYRESDLWLKKMMGLEYTDPETGEKVKAFDPEAVANLMRLDPEPVVVKGEFQELKDLLRTSIGRQDQVMYQFPRNLRVRKMYDILEEHKQDDEGRMWITWVNENYRDKVLGKMPYPVNFYGHTAFTDEVPLPDLIDAIGDSTPRLLRYMFSMFNLQMAQNFDYITNMIRLTYLAKVGVEFSQDRLESGVYNVIRTSDLNGSKFIERPPLPTGSMERGATILQLIGMFEPSLNLTTEGTEANPQAGKTATTAVLAAKAADVLLAMKMDGRNLYLRQLGQKKIWMNQQMSDMDQDWEVESKYFTSPMQNLLKSQTETAPWIMTDQTGKISTVKLNPGEIQQDLDVEPEAGSYMAVNDDLNRQSAMELDQAAMSAPGILDPKKVMMNHLKTIKHLDGDPESYFLPPPDPSAPPQPQKYNVTASVSIPLDKMEPEVQQYLLTKYLGAPPIEGLEHQAMLDTVGRVSQAADHADNMLSPAGQGGKPNGSVPKTPVGIAEASGGD